MSLKAHKNLSMSHAQMNRIGWRELAHRQTYSSSDVYGDAVHEEEARRVDSECRDSEQACLASLSAWRNREEDLNLLASLWLKKHMGE